jgi:hypothetical protein
MYVVCRRVCISRKWEPGARGSRTRIEERPLGSGERANGERSQTALVCMRRSKVAAPIVVFPAHWVKLERIGESIGVVTERRTTVCGGRELSLGF